MTTSMTLASKAVVDRALRHLQSSDDVIPKLMTRSGPFKYRRQTNRYQVLLRSIIAQQISSAAAKTIWSRVQTLVPAKRVAVENIQAISDDELRSVGVSPQKLKYVRSLNEHVVSGNLKLSSLHRLSDDEAIAALVQVTGIGIWTAQMMLMFSLGRPDILPYGDLGIRAAIRNAYHLDELPNRQQCEEIAQPWRPYATVACWYLWRSIEETDDWGQSKIKNGSK